MHGICGVSLSKDVKECDEYNFYIYYLILRDYC